MEFVWVPGNSNVKSKGINPSKGTDRQSSTKNRSLEDSPSDIVDIYTAYNNDALFRKACDKYVDLVFRNGYYFIHDKPELYEYIKLRIRMLEFSMGIPFDEFLRDIVSHIVQYDNAFLLVHRAKLPAQFSRIITGVNGQDPVIGYEILHPATMTIEKSEEYGNEIRYIQTPVGSRPSPRRSGNRRVSHSRDYRDFSKDEIIHIRTNRDAVYKFASPSKRAVVDDLIVLRELEENSAILIQKFIFPLIHAKVTRGSIETVNQWSRAINDAREDSIFVSSDDVNMEQVTGTSNVINADEYLRYFKNRVYSGLGVAPIIMGEGDSANRATADSIIVQMQDSVRAIQKTISNHLNMYVFDNFIQEHGQSVLDNKSRVLIKFNEIDITSLIGMETHHIVKYQNNLLSQDECRKELGLKPMTPKDIAGTMGKMYGQPADGSQQQSAKRAADSKSRPSNQYGKRIKPKRKSE